MGYTGPNHSQIKRKNRGLVNLGIRKRMAPQARVSSKLKERIKLQDKPYLKLDFTPFGTPFVTPIWVAFWVICATQNN